MKKKQKGFTLVELLVVIAILAVLATVSILGYSSFTRKAQLSNDEAICAQINLILQANEQEGKPTTVYEALQDVFAGGFDVEKLTPSCAGYHYLYNQDSNRFSVVEDDKLDGNVNVKDWLFVDAKDANNRGYSVYLIGNSNNETTINVNGGVDTAEVMNIETINYVHSETAHANVIINTYNVNTNITIDAPLDTIYHSGIVGNVLITRTANGSYHELGKAGYVECASGRVVADVGGEIITVVLTTQKTSGDIPACVQTNGGTITDAFATTKDVAEKNNNETNTDTLVIGTPGSENSDVLLTEEEAAKTGTELTNKVEGKITEKKTTTAEAFKNKVQLICEHSFENGYCKICGFSEHYWTENNVANNGDFVLIESGKYEIKSLNGLIIFAQELNKNINKFQNTTITLKVDIDLAGCYWAAMVADSITFDGDNHTIKNLSATTINNGKNTGFFGVASKSTIKNIKFENAIVSGINHVAVVVGDGLCAHIENCSVKNATVKSIVTNNDDGDKAAAICGYLSAEYNASIKNCNVEDVTIIGYRDLGAIAGMANESSNGGKAIVTGNTIKNATVIIDMMQPNYKNYTQQSEYNADIVVGRKATNFSVDSSNTYTGCQVTTKTEE